MKKILAFILLGVIPASLVGCASVPEKSALTQLSGDQIRSTLVGNTYTYREDWGRWANYYGPGGSGNAKAWGSWGAESATAKYTIEDDGEWCVKFNGEGDWANPDYLYCGILYTDADGNYYVESTKNPNEPSKVGKIRSVEIKTGDEYGLGG